MPISLIVSGTIKFWLNDSQLAKKLLPIVLILFGIITTLLNDAQPSKKLSPIVSTIFGIFIGCLKLEQSRKKLDPIVSTHFGIIISLLKEVHPVKKPSPIFVIGLPSIGWFLGMMISLLNLSCVYFSVLSQSIFIVYVVFLSSLGVYEKKSNNVGKNNFRYVFWSLFLNLSANSCT